MYLCVYAIVLTWGFPVSFFSHVCCPPVHCLCLREPSQPVRGGKRHRGKKINVFKYHSSRWVVLKLYLNFFSFFNNDFEWICSTSSILQKLFHKKKCSNNLWLEIVFTVNKNKLLWIYLEMQQSGSYWWAVRQIKIFFQQPDLWCIFVLMHK